MKTYKSFAMSLLGAAVLLGVVGCSGMSTRDKDTAIGAGVGAVGGAISSRVHTTARRSAHW